MKITRKKRTIPYNFPEWLKATRKKCNLTQENLADFLECSVSTIQKYEAGSRTPDFEVYDRVVKIFTNISAGTEVIRGLIRDLDTAVIEGASGNDRGVRQFWKNLTSAFFADELRDYLTEGFIDECIPPLARPPKPVNPQDICNCLSEMFFDGEALIVADRNGTLRCTDPISAAAKLYDLPYDKLPNNIPDETRDEYIQMYAWAKAIVFLALTEHIPEHDPESVVYYIYKVFSPLRRELIEVFEAALTEMADNKHAIADVQMGTSEVSPTAFIYHVIGEHIVKGHCHEALYFQ